VLGSASDDEIQRTVFQPHSWERIPRMAASTAS
jgi:hypothetical protein